MAVTFRRHNRSRTEPGLQAGWHLLSERAQVNDCPALRGRAEGAPHKRTFNGLAGVFGGLPNQTLSFTVHNWLMNDQLCNFGG